jgi:L-lactate dehydrogenase complex protein LldG
MRTDRVATFESELEGVSTIHRTTATEFAETLSAAITEPAVGTEVPIENVSLADTPVETDPSPADVLAAETGVTPAGLGVADYGTVTLPTDETLAEVLALYCIRHVAVLAGSDLVADMPAAYDRIAGDFGAGTDTQILATGPSSTADMGELLRGVHGPHETHVVVVTDR